MSWIYAIAYVHMNSNWIQKVAKDAHTMQETQKSVCISFSDMYQKRHLQNDKVSRIIAALCPDAQLENTQHLQWVT